MDQTDFHIAYTIVMLIVFIGIVAWAWSAKRKRGFQNAENLPFADEQQDVRASGNDAPKKENGHE